MSIVDDDLIERSVNIHWPDGYDPGHARPVRGQHHHHRRAHRRPSGPSSPPPRPGPPGTPTPATLSSTTQPEQLSEGEGHLQLDHVFGFKIASTVAEYVPHTRIGWYGTGDQLRAYHTWLLIPRHGKSTEPRRWKKTGIGPAARHLAQTNPGHMHRGHDLWNISLKFACES